MKKTIPGYIKNFSNRTGGYISYLHDSQKLKKHRNDIHGYTFEAHLHTKAEAERMLVEANTFIQKYFPWMKDLVIFQLSDGTVRLDVADRAFLHEE